MPRSASRSPAAAGRRTVGIAISRIGMLSAVRPVSRNKPKLTTSSLISRAVVRDIPAALATVLADGRIPLPSLPHDSKMRAKSTILAFFPLGYHSGGCHLRHRWYCHFQNSLLLIICCSMRKARPVVSSQPAGLRSQKCLSTCPLLSGQAHMMCLVRVYP